jgi:hypothetical protein
LVAGIYGQTAREVIARVTPPKVPIWLTITNAVGAEFATILDVQPIAHFRSLIFSWGCKGRRGLAVQVEDP